jgi:hypothetical protein
MTPAQPMVVSLFRRCDSEDRRADNVLSLPSISAMAWRLAR